MKLNLVKNKSVSVNFRPLFWIKSYAVYNHVSWSKPREASTNNGFMTLLNFLSTLVTKLTTKQEKTKKKRRWTNRVVTQMINIVDDDSAKKSNILGSNNFMVMPNWRQVDGEALLYMDMFMSMPTQWLSVCICTTISGWRPQISLAPA